MDRHPEVWYAVRTMWRARFEVALLIVWAGGPAACSDGQQATFPDGLGHDAGSAEAAPPSPGHDASPDTDPVPPPEAGHDGQQPPPDLSPDASPADASPADAGPDIAVVQPPGLPSDASVEANPPADAAPEASPLQPAVAIVSPEDGAVVSNPVTFLIAARNVAYVQLYADDYALGGPWDPVVDDTYEYTFLGLGYAREIRLVGLDLSQEQLVEQSITITVVE